MFIPLSLLVLAGLAFVLLAVMALRARPEREMIQDQQRRARRLNTKPAVALLPDEAAILADPEISAALAGGNKIAAIKLVRERTGLGLKESKDLVERLER